jgi:pimeloyl-ACP methyl ester carboxylesterase
MPIAAGIHYTFHDGGDHSKPPVLLIHGAGGDILSWPPEIRRLPNQMVYAIDLPGHGKTHGPGYQSIEDYAGSVIELINKVGLLKVVAVGASMGGAIALEMAVKHPDRLAGMTLISTGAHLPVPKRILDNATLPATYSLAARQLLEMYAGSRTPGDLKDLVLKRLMAARQTLMFSDLLACDRFEMTERLGEIHTPTLVICGRGDKITPLRFSETLSSRISGAALQTVEEGSHLLLLEQPRHIAKLVAVFLSTIAYQPGE